MIRAALSRLILWGSLALFCWLLPGAAHRVEHELLPHLDTQLAHLDDWHPPTVVDVRDRHGEPYDRFALVRRIWVPLDELAPATWQAVVASEDRRFFEHVGVDFLGILRAFVVNLRAGAIREGGSTLTQQLVKNLVVGKERSYVRKLEEALLAWRLEQRMPKARILELYVNYIYLGSGNYGVEAAAQDYFGVSARELDAGQAAMLAGLIPAPSAWSPRRDAEQAARRRALVLDAMADLSLVDPIVAEEAKRAPVDPPRREPPAGEVVGDAYRTAVRREVRRLLGDETPFAAGLTIHTPYDPAIQALAEQAVREAAADVEARQGHPGARDRLVRGAEIRDFLDQGLGLGWGPGGFLEPVEGDCFPAVYLGDRRVAAGPFRYFLDWRSWHRRIRTDDPEVPPRLLQSSARWGEVFDVCLTAPGYVGLPDVRWVEGAAAVVDHRTGGVVALVGGRDMPLEGFSRATQALRQPGSSFKPYVYAAAFEAGLTQIDKVMDAPIALPSGRGRVWSPRNAGGRYFGELPVRTAFALSLNTVAVRLALTAGLDRVIAVAEGAGLQGRLTRNAALALGASEVTVLEQAVGISAFARGGRSAEPVLVERLVDLDGDVVGEAGGEVRLEGPRRRLPGGPGARVVAPATAWQVLDLMRGVVTDGTGRGAWRAGHDRGGKTGTTSGSVDAWFVGFTETHTIAVWIGRDGTGTLGHGESGGRAALPAWAAIARALEDGAVGSEPLRPPDDVVLVPWADRWVGVAADDVPEERLPRAPVVDGVPLRAFPAARPPPCPSAQAQASVPASAAR